MGNLSVVSKIALLMVAVLALAACDQDEQGRILTYEKGTYLGKADSALSDEQLAELRQRAARQAGN